MAQIVEHARPRIRMLTFLRPPAIVACWLGLVALATAMFFAPRGTEAQPDINDAIGFGCSTAIAAAAAAITAFGIGGRRRWAVEMAVSISLLATFAALLVVDFVVLDPTFLRTQMDPWTILRLQHDAEHWAQQLAGYHGPLGAAVGITLGAAAGLLIQLARRWPRLATGTALAILFALASAFGRQFAFNLVSGAGMILRSRFVPWSISADQISTTGMIFGAVTGCTVASLAIHATRQRPRGVATAPHPARPAPAAS